MLFKVSKHVLLSEVTIASFDRICLQKSLVSGGGGSMDSLAERLVYIHARPPPPPVCLELIINST